MSPLLNDLNRPFCEAASEGMLLLPYCRESARHFWPPAPISPFTAGDVDWRGADPRGIVESVVIYRRAFQSAFAPLLPYGIALVALDAGPRLLAHVPSPDAAASPRAGERVSIAFTRLIEGGTLVPTAIALPQPQEPACQEP